MGCEWMRGRVHESEKAVKKTLKKGCERCLLNTLFLLLSHPYLTLTSYPPSPVCTKERKGMQVRENSGMNKVFELAGERGCASTQYIVCLTDITLADNVTWTVDRMECRCVGMESRQSP